MVALQKMERAGGVQRRTPEGGVQAYVALFRASPEERIRMIKEGVPAAEAKRILFDLSISQSAAFEALRLSAATVNKKAARAEALSTSEGERVLGVAKLVGQLQVMVEESGDPEEFDAAAWISRWLREPVPALGGQRPLDLLDTMEGQALVSGTLAKLQSGAYG